MILILCTIFISKYILLHIKIKFLNICIFIMIKLNKSKLDENTYNIIELKNKIEVLLIENMKKKDTIVSLMINIGSHNEKINGLAHFLEHMLFMGNKKYKEENYYRDTLTKYGGTSNAFTLNNYTCYYFKILSQYVEIILDIFVHFFIDPLFNKDSVDRELESVNSEFNKIYNNDNVKMEDVLNKYLFNKYDIFTCGNRKTLKIKNIYEELLSFYNKYYSSNLMKVVIEGNHNTATLVKLAKKFELIKNKNSIAQKINYSPINSIHLTIKSETDKNKLILLWQIKSDLDFQFIKPLYFITTMFTSSQKNSLYYKLFELRLITNIQSNYNIDYADNDNVNNEYYLYRLEFELTNLGIKNRNIIISYTFNYINFLKNSDNIRKYYEDLQKFSKINMLYSDYIYDMDYIIYFNSKLFFYNGYKKDMIISDYVFSDYNYSIILSYLNMFSKNNLIIIFSSPECKTNLVSKWYKTKYSIKNNPKIPDNNKIQFTKLSLNPFIDNICLKTIDHKNYYDKFKKKNNTYYKINNYYKRPIMCVLIKIKSVHINTNIQNYIYSNLLILLLSDHLKDIIYHVENLSSKLSIYVENDNFIISISGLSDIVKKILLIIKKKILMEKIIFDDNKLKLFTAVIKNNMRAKQKMDPYKYIYALIKKMLVKNVYLTDDIYKYLQNNDITMEHIYDMMSNIFGGNYMFVIHGNCSTKLVNFIDELKKNIYSNKIIAKNNFNKINEINIPKNMETKIINKNRNEKNTAVALIYCIEYIKYQQTYNWEKIICNWMLLENIISEYFFTEIRTRKTFGYIASCNNTIYNVGDKLLYATIFMVQTTKKTELLLSALDVFFYNFLDYLNKMSDKEFDIYKKSLELILSKKHNTLEDEFYFYSSMMMDDNYCHDVNSILKKKLSMITRNDLIKFYLYYYIKDTKKRNIAMYLGNNYLP